MTDVTPSPVLIVQLDVILRAIREERTFRADFSAVADTINDKIFSFYANPNCSCKGAIIEWIHNNVDKTNAVITKNEAALTAMTADAQKAAAIVKATAPVQSNKQPQFPGAPQSSMATNVSGAPAPNTKFGKIVNIERTEAAYAALIAQIMAERWVFRGMNVVPNIVGGLEVWSVFFF